MPDSIWLLVCAGFASLAFAVGHYTGGRMERARRWVDDQIYWAAERLHRDVYGEGEDG